MVTKEQVLEKLKDVIDPELHINIVDLGLVYEVEISTIEDKASTSLSQEYKVAITMTLTSPGCPLSAVFEELVPAAAKKVDGVKSVRINLVWEPPWDPDKISDYAKEELGIIK